MAGNAPTTIAQDILAAIGVNVSVDLPDLTGPDFSVPAADAVTTEISAATLSEYTEKGEPESAVFDALMRSIKSHFTAEFEAGKISGQQLTQIYTEATPACMTTALQFLLQKDKARAEALLAQSQARRAEIEAVTASVALEQAKVQLATLQTTLEKERAQTALVTLQLATEQWRACAAEEQVSLVREQAETQRAQTSDTRSDGVTPVAGVSGKQKELYAQQVQAYIDDSSYKVGKLYTDIFALMRSVDEGFPTPVEFQEASLNSVVSNLRARQNL